MTNPWPTLVKNGACESEPVVLSGRVLLVSFVRPFIAHGPYYVEVSDWFTGEALGTNPWSGALGTAIVVDGNIEIFGSSPTDGTNGNSIIRSILDARNNFAPSTPQTVLTAPNTNEFKNSSICADPLGWALEIEVNGAFRTFHSTDRISWTQIGTWTGGGVPYIGCPTIKYRPADGKYYHSFLSLTSPTFVTWMIRAALDYSSLDWSAITLLSPDTPATSASDLGYIESNGIVYCNWLISDQATWAETRKGRFFGTMDQMHAGMF